jgi:hypothetical protein
MAERTGLEPAEGANRINKLLIPKGQVSPEIPLSPRIRQFLGQLQIPLHQGRTTQIDEIGPLFRSLLTD